MKFLRRRDFIRTGARAAAGVVAGVPLATAASAGARRSGKPIKVGQIGVGHAHAAGKAWLSTQPLEEAIGLVQQAGLKKFTDFTLTSIKAIRKDLVLTRERGYSISDQEHDYGVTSIGTPIMTVAGPENNLCVGIVSLAAPTSRMSRDALEGCAPLLKSVAERLARIWPSTAIHTHADPLSSASGKLP